MGVWRSQRKKQWSLSEQVQLASQGPDIPKGTLRVGSSSHARARWGALGKSILVTSQGGGESGGFLFFFFYYS